MIGTSVIKKLNTGEKSDTDLPKLGIISPYLHGYTNHLTPMQNATIDETTSRFNGCMVHGSPKTCHE